jgi:hypothetical protein
MWVSTRRPASVILMRTIFGSGGSGQVTQKGPSLAARHRSAIVPPISCLTVWRSQAETESTASRDASRQGESHALTFALVAVFISALTLGFALNPNNREDLNRGLEMLRKVGGIQLSYIH